MGVVFEGHANLCQLCREHRWNCHEELLTKIIDKDDNDDDEQKVRDVLCEEGDIFEQDRRQMKKAISGAEARRTCEEIAGGIMRTLESSGGNSYQPSRDGGFEGLERNQQFE